MFLAGRQINNEWNELIAATPRVGELNKLYSFYFFCLCGRNGKKSLIGSLPPLKEENNSSFILRNEMLWVVLPPALSLLSLIPPLFFLHKDKLFHYFFFIQSISFIFTIN